MSDGHNICLQGDLTDPSYFDFISYVQMATVSKQILSGQQEFEVQAYYTCAPPSMNKKGPSIRPA